MQPARPAAEPAPWLRVAGGGTSAVVILRSPDIAVNDEKAETPMPSKFDPDDLSAEERQTWDRFVQRSRDELVDMVDSSAFMMSLVPKGDVDIQFAVELGLGIMLDKPIVAVAVNGTPVPPGLRRVAHAVIEVGDIDTAAGREDFVRKLEVAAQELGISFQS